jgi:putative phosphoribosyl transferase
MNREPLYQEPTLDLPFADRRDAGRRLADALGDYRHRRDLLILALPRGGVPVAAEVAEALDAPLDLMLVRKLGVPAQPELAMGAIASGGQRVLNPQIIQALGIDDRTIEAVAEREGRELARREQAYRGGRPLPRIAEQCVILVDDGLATGATMRAAVAAVTAQAPACLVVAVPVGSEEAVALLRPHLDRMLCLAAPEPFMGVGRWYRSFEQTSDDEVRRLLQDAWERQQYEALETAHGRAP